ncbi:MAG TPA: hypothetical protein VE913_20590, partial [Longimicrobium sp.]|nr:hypothetical protein [Longimicrobium sp.]
ISTRSIRTALLVKDGETAVLGGLSEAQRERSSGGIPLLSSIPFIGGIFGSKARGSRDTELFVFLTPRVVRDDAEMEATTRDVRRNGGRAGKTAEKTPSVILPRPAKTPAPPPAPRPSVPVPATPPGPPMYPPTLPAPRPE